MIPLHTNRRDKFRFIEQLEFRLVGLRHASTGRNKSVFASVYGEMVVFLRTGGACPSPTVYNDNLTDQSEFGIRFCAEKQSRYMQFSALTLLRPMGKYDMIRLYFIILFHDSHKYISETQ